MRGGKIGLAALAAMALVGATGPSRDRQALARAMLAVHNDARAAAGVPPLVWDDALADDAQVWADFLADTGRYEHSRGPRGRDRAGEGENLFRGTAGGYSWAEMAGYWVAERRYFRNGAVPDISNTGNWTDAGHYSQIVWRGTTRLGCAVATGAGYDYLVCRYSPPGNMIGQRAL